MGEAMTTTTDAQPGGGLRIADGAAVIVNRVTAPFPATMTGNAEFDGNVDPSPCIAPIVFVTSGTGDPPGGWFSVTGV
jgi:hypothetical protein